MPDKKSEQIRVLVVEDDGAARVGLQQLIRGWGFDVETAADGDEALQKSQTFRPVIVLTDLVMPKMGGLDLLRGLQQQGDHITTILLTAQGTVETAVEAIKLGARHYLAKPANTDDIEAAFGRPEGNAEVGLTERQTSIKTLEWERIHETLAETGFNISETARRLGMHRRTLARKLEKQRVK